MPHRFFSGLESKPLVQVSPRTSHPCSIRCSLQWRYDDPAPVSAGFKATQQGDNRHFCPRICPSDLASALQARANCRDCMSACTGVHTKASPDYDTLCTVSTSVFAGCFAHYQDCSLQTSVLPTRGPTSSAGGLRSVPRSGIRSTGRGFPADHLKKVNKNLPFAPGEYYTLSTAASRVLHIIAESA